MKLTKRNLYGLLLVTYLLRSGRTTLKTVAANLSISLSFLEQVSHSLAKACIIKVTRGPGGGVELANVVPTALDVIQALDPIEIIKTEDRDTLRTGKQEHRTVADVTDAISKTLYVGLSKMFLQEQLTKTTQRELEQLESANETSMV